MQSTADKILINVLSVSLWYTGTLPTPLVGLWLVRDVVLMTATYRYVRAHTAAGLSVLDPLTTPLQVNPTTISSRWPWGLFIPRSLTWQ